MLFERRLWHIIAISIVSELLTVTSNCAPLLFYGLNTHSAYLLFIRKFQ